MKFNSKYEKLINNSSLNEDLKKKLLKGLMGVAMSATTPSAATPIKPSRIVKPTSNYQWLEEYLTKLKFWEGIERKPKWDRTGYSIGHGTHYGSWADPILKKHGITWEELKNGTKIIDNKLADDLLRAKIDIKIDKLKQKFPDYDNFDKALQLWLLEGSYLYGLYGTPAFHKLAKSDPNNLPKLWAEFKNSDTFRDAMNKKPGPYKDRHTTHAKWYADAIRRSKRN